MSKEWESSLTSCKGLGVERTGTPAARGTNYLHDELPGVRPRHRGALAGSEDPDGPDIESSRAEVTPQDDALERRFGGGRQVQSHTREPGHGGAGEFPRARINHGWGVEGEGMICFGAGGGGAAFPAPAAAGAAPHGPWV